MESLEDLETRINDFLPLLPLNIKQELLDSNETTGNICDSVEKQVSLKKNDKKKERYGYG